MVKVDLIAIWLDAVAFSHSNSKRTRSHYTDYINEFFEYTESTPEQISADYDSMDEKQFKKKYTAIIMSFLSKQRESKRLTSTQQNVISGVRSFFKYNSWPLNFIPTGRRIVVFHNRDIRKDEIEEVIKNSRPREKAYYALMVQSGLRPNEISNLKVENFEKLLEENTPIPCMITIPQEITKGQYKEYFTFTGQESISYIKEYFKRDNRYPAPDSYIFTQTDGQSKTDTDLISHLFTRTVKNLKRQKVIDFKNKKSELTNRNELRLYNLRKYFRMNAGSAGPDYVNFWMGHSLGVDGHYFSKTDTEMHRKQYREKAMPNLRIDEKLPSQNEQTLNELEQRLKNQTDEIDYLKHENRELSQQLAHLERITSKILEQMEKEKRQDIDVILDDKTQKN